MGSVPCLGQTYRARETPRQIRYRLETYLFKDPPGAGHLCRGFARRKVFQTLLALKHHILCWAKSNAVFYRIPQPRKRPGPGCPKKYGDRLNIRRLRYKGVSIMGKDYQVASQIARTRMCPADVRLVVIRTKPRRSKPYRYFLVFTTDLTLEIPQIVEYYRQRWQIETAFRDAKQHFGFNGYKLYQTVASTSATTFQLPAENPYKHLDV